MIKNKSKIDETLRIILGELVIIAR